MKKRAFTLVEIMIVVLLISILLSIAIPNFMKSRSKAHQTACIDNLRITNQAKEQFGMDTNLANGSAIAFTDLIPTYIKGQTPTCPAGGTYSVNALGTDPACTIIAGDNPHKL